jgi:hypothetical protein
MYVYLSHHKISVNVYKEFLIWYISVPVDKNTCSIRTYVTVRDSVLLGYDAMLVCDPILTFTGNTVTWNSSVAMSKKNSTHPEVSGTQYPVMQHHIPEEWTPQISVKFTRLICIKSSALYIIPFHISTWIWAVGLRKTQSIMTSF